MKKVLFKITSFAMALLLLFSTMSFAVDMHYCMGKLVDFSLFDKVESCNMMSDVMDSSDTCPSMKMEMHCCQDVQIAQMGQHDLKIALDQPSCDQQYFIAVYFNPYLRLFEGPEENITAFNDYTPPPLIRDIHILDQSFLI
ncbi:MAG: hypothetical protein WBN18_07230 [Flavobacteriaceae bacterium]